MTIVKKLASGASSLVQVLTGIVGSIMFFTRCGIRITAKLLTFCAWAGLVPAVIGLILMVATILRKKLTQSLYNAFEKYNDYHQLTKGTYLIVSPDIYSQ